MIEDDENEFYSFNEDEDKESEEEKSKIDEENDERSISTAVNPNQNESSIKEIKKENQSGTDLKLKPNLSDIILENLNKRRKLKSSINIDTNSLNQSPTQMNSDFVSSNDSNEKPIFNSILFTTSENRFKKFQTNFKEKNCQENEETIEKESIFKNDSNSNNNDLMVNKENFDSMNNSANEKSHYESDKIKVPLLLNSLEAIYDMNAERNRKRMEQMKMRKTKLGSEFRQIDNPHSLEEEMKPNKIKLLSSKRFLEEENLSHESSRDPSEAAFPLLIKEEKENEREENVEVVVSDLEGEIEEKTIITKTSNKSFIPLTNHLKSKSSQKLDNATPSYLMALGFNVDDESNSVEDESNEREYNLDSLNEKTSQNNFMSKQNNYFVSDVIEEETSENNTDSEILTARKRPSYLFQTKGSSITSENESSHVESPTVMSRISNNINNSNLNLNHMSSFKSNKEIRHSNSDVPCGPYYLEGNKFSLFNFSHNVALNDDVKGPKKIHKNSKSEFLNFKLDMQKIIENIQKKRDEEGNKRRELMKLRKDMLLNKFLKSNSHHNFQANCNISAPSLNNFKQDQSRFYNKNHASICTPKPNFTESIFKKLSASELSRAVHYENETAMCNTTKSEKADLNKKELISDENNDRENIHERHSLLNKEDDKVFIVENCENEMGPDEEELEGNRSIILEKGDQEINFESELNLQLERNDINSEYHEDNFYTNDAEQEMLSNESDHMDSESNPNEKTKTLFNFEDNKQNRLLLNNFNHFNSISSFNKNYLNIITRDKEFTKTRKTNNNNILSNLIRRDKITGRSNSLTFLTPINSKIENKFTPSKTEKTKFNFEIAKAAILQITPITQNTKTIYNNAYINNNINNISINIMNTDFKVKQSNLKGKHFTSNSITNEIKNKLAMHVKSSSAFLLKPQIHNELRYESTNCSKNIRTGQSFADSAKLNKNMRNTELMSSRKKMMLMHKKDLKQYLTYSDSKSTNIDNQSKSKNLFKYLIQINSNNSSVNFDRVNPKFNSDYVAHQLIKSSNRLTIIEAMKSLRFQTSSLDHQKFSLDRLNRSKAKSFCLLICKEFTFQNFEFKGLYEINEEKTYLTKIYSVNGNYPNHIDIDEVLSSQNKLTCDIHAIDIKNSFKHLLKQYSYGK